MNDNYDGTNQDNTDSSNTYGSSPYQDPSQKGQTASEPNQQTYDGQFSYGEQQMNNEQSPYSQPENQQQNPYEQANYIPNDYNQSGYNPNNMNQTSNNQYAYAPYPNTPANQNTITTQSKKSYKWMWGFTAIPILAIVAILCFFFIPSFQNFVYKKALGTTKYYEHIESSCNEKVKDEFSSLPKSKKIDLSKGISAKGNLSLKLDSLLTSQLGFDVNDFTCDYTTSIKDKKAIASYKIMYREKEIGTFELYNDTETGKMYIKIPQLSDQYIDYTALLDKYSSSTSDFTTNFQSKIKDLSTESVTATNSYAEIQKFTQKLMTQLDSDTTSALVKDYLKFIIDSIGDKGAIKLNDKETLRVGNLEEDCEAFTITLTPSQVVEVIKEVLNKAKDDQKILDIIKNVMDDTTAYTTTIDKLLGELESADLASFNPEDNFKMKVYTDGEQILGRKFIINASNSEPVSFEYGMLSTKDQTSFNITITPEDASEQVSLGYQAKKDGDKHAGSATFAVDHRTYTLDFKDFKINDDAIMEGRFSTTISSLYNVSLNLSNNNGVQGLTAAINIAGKELGSISAEATREELKEFNYPEISDDKVVTITDNASLAAYLKDSNLSSFLDTIISTFNLPSTLDGTAIANEIISKLENENALPDSSNHNKLY